jgi:hypothetical protein
MKLKIDTFESALPFANKEILFINVIGTMMQNASPMNISS